MNTPRFTPGPWTLHANGRTILSNQSHPVATLSDPDQRQVEISPGVIATGDDGPLIAAAPDLYSALRAIISPTYIPPVDARVLTLNVSMTRAEYMAARAALAKAEGRTP